jgi:regulator of sirC expression with transglutaminase-like and TPR domain
MNTSIQRVLDKDDVLSASLLVAQQFEADMSLSFYLSMMKQWETLFRSRINFRSSTPQQLQQLNTLFFTELGFAGQPGNLLASNYALMDQVMLYRNGCAVCLCILYCHLARAMGLDARGVSFPGHYLVRVRLSDRQYQFMDALTGKSLSWPELERLYQQIAADGQEENMPADIVIPATDRDMLIRLLQNLKGAFINQDQFQQALTVSDLLVTLSPDDPYERRGRGWLLQQLNCHGGAYADYQYYIRQCPQDPAAHLLKLQLRSHSLKPEVLH